MLRESGKLVDEAHPVLWALPQSNDSPSTHTDTSLTHALQGVQPILHAKWVICLHDLRSMDFATFSVSLRVPCLKCTLQILAASIELVPGLHLSQQLIIGLCFNSIKNAIFTTSLVTPWQCVWSLQIRRAQSNGKAGMPP